MMKKNVPIADCRESESGIQWLGQPDKALAVIESEYQETFNGAIEGICRISPEGKYLNVNPAFARMLGYEPSPGVVDEINNSSHQIWADAAERARFVQRLIEERQVAAYECQFARRDGAKIWVTLNSRAVLGAEGEVAYFEEFIEDISQRKQSEAEMGLLRFELEHLARVMTMNQLSTSLAHEINQPLGAILNNASAAKIMLSQAAHSTEEIADILSDIIKDAKRAGDVVRKIRGVVKKSEALFEPLYMNTLIKDVVALFENSAAIEGVSIVLDLDPVLPRVKGDRVRLQQVLLNLITNAMDAMQGSPAKMLTVRSCARDEDSILVVVGDTGPGIAEIKKINAHKPFYTTKKDGLGMGLGICRVIVAEHGGRIWAENNPVAGATFSFSLSAWKGGRP